LRFSFERWHGGASATRRLLTPFRAIWYKADESGILNGDRRKRVFSWLSLLVEELEKSGFIDSVYKG
jgi:hypothetical protein